MSSVYPVSSIETGNSEIRMKFVNVKLMERRERIFSFLDLLFRFRLLFLFPFNLRKFADKKCQTCNQKICIVMQSTTELNSS